MLEANRNKNIEIISYSEVEKIEGYVGNYRVTIKRKPRFVIEDLCNGCGDCTPVCPIYVPNYWQENIGARKCIDISFGQAIPFVYDLEKESCVECYACVDACEPHAIDLSQEPEFLELDIGTIIVATGWDLYDPQEFGFGVYDNVINQIHLERILAPNGPTTGHVKRLSDGKTPKEILFINCVGSRDEERTYCSGVCCMIGLKNARLLKEEVPDAHITMCYIDIRTNEKNFEEYYMRARGEGIDLIRGKVAELLEDLDTKNLKARIYSSLTDEIIKIEADLVVLSTAVLPSKGTKQIADILGIDYDTHGYLTEHHFGLSPQETKYLGVYICGFAQGPKNISYSVSQARAAASKVAELTAKGKAELELICAVVDEDCCISCNRCEKNCPKNAIISPEDKPAEVDEINCDGCGICATCCPTQAIQIRYYEDEQILSELLTLIKEVSF